MSPRLDHRPISIITEYPLPSLMLPIALLGIKDLPRERLPKAESGVISNALSVTTTNIFLFTSKSINNIFNSKFLIGDGFGVITLDSERSGNAWCSLSWYTRSRIACTVIKI
jgi:hypothetical protein